ncbi:MAG: ankyrin repeat domain-containing protein, partial [Deltaproteobacteria bacterium]
YLVQAAFDAPATLIQEVSRGHLAPVRLLLAADGDVNSTDAKGWTPLLHAANGGHAEIVEVLLSSGAHVNAQSKRGWTALTLAVLRRHTEIVRRLVAAGADVNLKNSAGDPPLIIASQFELVVQRLALSAKSVIPGRGPDSVVVLSPPRRVKQSGTGSPSSSRCCSMPEPIPTPKAGTG